MAKFKKTTASGALSEITFFSSGQRAVKFKLGENFNTDRILDNTEALVSALPDVINVYIGKQRCIPTYAWSKI